MFPPKLSPKLIWKNLSNLGVLDRSIPSNNFNSDEINKHFTTSQSVNNILSLNNDFIQDTLPLSNSKTELNFHSVSVNDVLHVIHSIKSSACGIDNVCPKFVKIILPCIVQVITHIFNHILTTSLFPSDWKVAKVIPIPKKDKIETLDDLRPISILPFLSKAFEKLMQFQISEYLESNKLLNAHQSGFRKWHSTCSALLKVHSDLLISLDQSKAGVIVLLDFSKAFDCVPHNLLLQKLTHYFYFSRGTVKLMASYLQNRSQLVFCNNVLSETCALTAGVPQGSILGPLLFSLFVNDLPLVLQYSDYHLYADDFQIYKVADLCDIDTCIDNVNQDLKRIVNWSNRNGIQLNITKTQAMLIHRKGINVLSTPIRLLDVVIPFVDHIKNLGLIFDSHLSWDRDINRIVSNTYSTLRQLWKFSGCLPIYIRRQLVVSLIMPHFVYGCSVRSKLPVYNEYKLEMAFNSCLRFVCGLRKYDRLTPYRDKILGYSLDKYLKIQILVFLYKIIKNKRPVYLYSKIVFASSTRTLNLIVPKFRSEFYKRSFFVHAITLWNSLPPDSKRSNTVNSFKLACENFH